MKQLSAGLILSAALFLGSCEVFFSGGRGVGTLILTVEEAPRRSASFDVPDTFPPLGEARLRVYNSARQPVGASAGSGEMELTVPAGGPYWVDFSAPVIHDPEPASDAFPFVKSFGATARVEQVEAGSTQTIRLPLRVRETAIMAPYRPEGQGVLTGGFTPLYGLPAEYPLNAGYVNRNFDPDGDYYFEIDPYGRLITTVGGASHIQAAENLGNLRSLVNPLLVHFYGFAYQLPEGDLYFTYRLGDTYHFSRESNTLLQDLSSPWGPAISSPLITIDEEGTLYGIQDDRIAAWDMAGGYTGSPSYSLDTDQIRGGAAPGGTISGIADLKALDGYLYALLRIREGQTGYGLLAALPLESVKGGNIRGMWFAGGKIPETAMARESREGFFQPQKIVGWGPERLYVFDETQLPAGRDNYYRIVEVDLPARGISGAGLFVRK